MDILDIVRVRRLEAEAESSTFGTARSVHEAPPGRQYALLLLGVTQADQVFDANEILRQIGWTPPDDRPPAPPETSFLLRLPPEGLSFDRLKLEAIRSTLALTNDHQVRAAAMLGISRPTLAGWRARLLRGE